MTLLVYMIIISSQGHVVAEVTPHACEQAKQQIESQFNVHVFCIPRKAPE